LNVVPDSRSELAVPLLDGDHVLGVINIEDPDVGRFTEEDLKFVETLAVQAVIAVHSVTLHQKLERRVQHLLVFSQTARRVHAAGDLDTRLRLLLTGITSGYGLGFSRAMLFLKDSDHLRGRLAIGPLSREEANRIWESAVVDPIFWTRKEAFLR
jgi:hypothetical protein